MKQLRFWFITMIAWFFLLYNVERFSEPINLASFVYILVAVFAMLIVFFSWFQKISLVWLFLMSLPLVFALKFWLGYQIGGKNLPITITEICALWLTIFLARNVGQGLEEFRKAATNAMISHLQNLAHPFEVGQGEMYREVRRARTHQQPLALLAISASDETLELSVDRFIKEVQREMIKKYIIARLANLLSKEMRDYDIITQRGDHFITLLPGMTRENAFEVIKELESAAKEELGLNLNFGLSTFPAEVTFEKLVERAETDLIKRFDRKERAGTGLIEKFDRNLATTKNGQVEDMTARVKTVFRKEKNIAG